LRVNITKMSKTMHSWAVFFVAALGKENGTEIYCTVHFSCSVYSSHFERWLVEVVEL
jgi:hypothetical protein